MLTAKAKQELSPRDYSFLEKLVGRGTALMTPAEKTHVVARRDYLSEETLKELDIENLKEETEEVNEQVSPYASMKAKELKELCVGRGIEGVTKKDEMVEALDADDRGELEEEEAGEEDEAEDEA